MMRTVYLHGSLGKKFGRKFRFEIATAGEAFRALYTALGSPFLEALRDGSFRIIRGKRRGGLELTAELLNSLRLGDADLHIVPVARGAANGRKGGTVKAVLGLVIIGAAIFMSGGTLAAPLAGLGASAFSIGGMAITWGNIALLGLGLTLAGASTLLSNASDGSTGDADDDSSYSLSGPTNTSEQGNPVPLVYGKVICGSQAVSAGFDIEDMNAYTGQYGSLDSSVIGGKGKSSDSSSGTESPNTLRSNTRARIVELLSEGEIIGLIDGAKSIYFDQTPLQNADGSFNFNGVVWDMRVGTPDQPHLNGFSSAETPVSVNTQVKMSTGPVVRTIVDENADAVRVVVRIPALANQNRDTGDTTGTTVGYRIDVRASGGGWVEVDGASLINQKCVSEYKRAHRIVLPPGGAPWDIRVRRDWPDSTEVTLQNETWFDSYVILVEGKFTYGDSAVVALNIDASQFGNSIPTRSFHVYGKKVFVPSNYNSITRTYTGVWDGSWAYGWTNNPVWVFYDLLTNSRYGIGEFVDATTVDKWALYRIAQYCDQMVPSGFNDPLGAPIMEPRFTFNGVINTRQEAYKVLQNIAATFRGMAYWSLGQVITTADMPDDPVTQLVPANVIDGHFRYSGTSAKARHSVALVSWNDPDDFFRAAVEVVQDDEMLHRFGWREVEVVQSGCTSRGLAHRYGKWILDTEKHETETVEFTMSFDGFVLEGNSTLKPGDIIMIADPRKNGGVRAGGRIKNVVNTALFDLDMPFEPAEGETYTITVQLPSGKIETKGVAAFLNANQRIGTDDVLSEMPAPGALWVIQGTDIVARKYRVVSIQETDAHLFKISALFHDPTKYTRIEQGINLQPIPYVRPRNKVSPVTNVTAVESRFFQNGVSHSRVTLSWSTPNDFQILDFLVTADSPHGFVSFPRVQMPVLDIMDAARGDWTFYITALSRSGSASSLPVAFNFTVEGWEAVDGPIVGDLEVQGGGNVFSGTACTITWNNVFPVNAVVYPVENVVRVYDAVDNLLRTDVVRQPIYTYSYEMNVNDGGPRRAFRIDVSAKQVTGIESAPATILVSNPVPAAVVPTAEGFVEMIDISYQPVDTDFAGAMIWVSNLSGFNPALLTPDYDGSDTKITIFRGQGTWYIRVALYDTFGKIGLNYSPQIEVSVSDVAAELAKVAPAIQKANEEALEEVADALAILQTTVARIKDGTDSRFERLRQELAEALDENGAAIVTESEIRNEADFNEASQRTVLAARVDTAEAAITTEATTRASADTALAETIDLLDASVFDGATSVNGRLVELNRVTVDVTNGTSLVNQITNLTAATTGPGGSSLQSQITNLSTATVGPGPTSLASQLSSLSTTVGSHTATITSHTSSIDGFKVQYSLTGSIDGVTGGFVFTGVRDLQGSVSYGLLINANVIINGTVTGDKIAANAITAGHIQAGHVWAAHIAAGNIVAGHLGVGAVNAGNILVDDILVTGHLRADAATAMSQASYGSLGLSPSFYIYSNLMTSTALVGKVLVIISFELNGAYQTPVPVWLLVDGVRVRAATVQMGMTYDISANTVRGGSNGVTTTIMHSMTVAAGSRAYGIEVDSTKIGVTGGYSFTNLTIAVLESRR